MGSMKIIFIKLRKRIQDKVLKKENYFKTYKQHTTGFRMWHN